MSASVSPEAQISFKMGERVRARVSSESTFRPGQIVAVHRSGLYDVAFDDGLRPKEGLDMSSVDIVGGIKEVVDTQGTDEIYPPTGDSRCDFKIGEQVEVFRSGRDWRMAIITGVQLEDHGSKYDVVYSDHVSEVAVPGMFVRRLFAEDSAAVSVLAGADYESNGNSGSGQWEVGTKVDARYHGGRIHYPGVITGFSNDGKSVDILYNDGDSESAVPKEYVRSAESTATALVAQMPAGTRAEPPTNAAFAVGAKVEGNFQGRNLWYPGTITRIRGVNGSVKYGVLYNDGDSEDNVPEDMLRILGAKPRVPSVPSTNLSTGTTSSARPTPQKVYRRSEQSSPLSEGVDGKLTEEEKMLAALKVQGNYGGLGVWLPARIVREVEDGFVELFYDNGAREGRVPVERVRLVSKPPAIKSDPLGGESSAQQVPTTPCKDDYQVQDAVECDYKGAGQYFPGKIIQIRIMATGRRVYDVLLEDGIQETSVPPSRLRVVVKPEARPPAPSVSSPPPKPGAKAAVALEQSKPADREDQLALSLGTLVEACDEDGRWQLARILHIYFEDEERYHLRLVTTHAVVRGATIRDIRLPRTAARSGTSSGASSTQQPLQQEQSQKPQGLLVRPDELVALRQLLQQKDAQIHQLRTARNLRDELTLDEEGTLRVEDLQTPSRRFSPDHDDVMLLKQEVAELKRAVAFLTQKFSLVISEVVQLKTQEERLLGLVKSLQP